MIDKKLFVLKIGSSLLTTNDGRFNIDYLVKIADIINENVFAKGHEIIIVTSGAIATGFGLVDMKVRPKTLPEKQALAAIGQVQLMNHYNIVFLKYKKQIAQILLTKSHIEDRQRYLNIRNTIFTLLKNGIIPIVNENDTVSVNEIQFGDNDTLAATVAAKMGADELVILTDVEGVYTENPRKCLDAKLIKEIHIKNHNKLDIDFSGKTGSSCGTGGMETKLEAAKISCFSGVKVFITSGLKDLDKLFVDYSKGTCFIPTEEAFTHRQRWMVFGARSKGEVMVDDGAENALLNLGKSLLPAGVKKVAGNFEKGDIIDIVNLKSECFAKGIVQYSNLDLDKYKGMSTQDIKDKTVVIHRDNMVFLK